MSIQYNQDSDTTYPMFNLSVGSPLISYEQFVTNLVKALGSDEQDMIHMMMGITGEAGELMDAIKKHTIYGKPLDLENVIEELGDLEFYMAGLRQILSIKRDHVLESNFLKLKQRYKSGSYSDAAAIARADKAPAEAVLLGPDGAELPSTSREAALQIIDMSKVVSDEQVDAVDETSVYTQTK